MKVNTKFIKEVKEYGAFDISACFNCGNCTAICPLSKEDSSFPRKMIRYAQIGAEEKIRSSLEPWMCYYCGECSDTCPRQAYPGEFMMSLRRYLISKYDVSGISKFLYKFPWLQIFITVSIFLVSLFFFLNYQGDFQELAAKIEYAFPVYVSFAIAGYLFMMYKNVILNNYKKWFLSFNFTNIKETIIHGLTQKNFLSCSQDNLRWISHILVMSGYTLTLIISNLHLLQPLKKQYSFTNILSPLVLYATLSILSGGMIMMTRRATKKNQSSKFSHPTDWLFVIMLFLIGVSTLITFLSNIFYGPNSKIVEILYKINIAIEISWIIIIVPFTKWIHIFFRPAAIYFYNLKKEHNLA